MRRIELCLVDGSHVAFVEVPPFNKDPDVLIWGERVFVPRVSLTADEPVVVYVEAFAYFVPPPLSPT